MKRLFQYFLLFSAFSASLLHLQVQAASSESRQTVQSMYVAYYGRPGDPAGVAWWADQLEINGGDLSQIINQFGNSDEYLERFSGISTQSLIESLYTQMFGRAAESAGRDWWAQQIDGGQVTLVEAAVEIKNGAQGSDVKTLNNRVEAAQTFTNYVETLNKKMTLESLSAISSAIETVTSATDVATYTSSAEFMDILNALPADDAPSDSGTDAVSLGKAKSVVCAACHGVEGVSLIPNYPSLAGLEEDYLISRLVYFKNLESATGTEVVMSAMMSGLSDQDIVNLAAFYSSLVVTP